MNPRLTLILTLVVVAAAAGVSAITWIIAQPLATPVSGSGAAAMKSSSDEEKRRHRKEFFGGNSNRDIRGGQEMKPRW